MNQALSEALLALDLKPNTVVFFNRTAINPRQLAELDLPLDYSVTCIPMDVTPGKTLEDSIRAISFEQIAELVITQP